MKVYSSQNKIVHKTKTNIITSCCTYNTNYTKYYRTTKIHSAPPTNGAQPPKENMKINVSTAIKFIILLLGTCYYIVATLLQELVRNAYTTKILLNHVR